MSVALHFNEDDHPFSECARTPRQQFCCYLSLSSFTTHASGFGDFKAFQSSKQLARFVQLSAYLVQNPQLAYVPGEEDPPYDPNDLSSRGPPPPRASAKYFLDSSGTYSTKTEQFVEVVKGVDRITVVGYRLWIMVYDVCFDFATGILNTILLMKRQKEQAEKRPFLQSNLPTASEKYRHVVDLICWSEGICDSYLRAQRMGAERANIFNPDTLLNCTENPAHPDNIFTVERAMEYAERDGAQTVQCCLDNYLDDSGKASFAEATQVWRIHSEQLRHTRPHTRHRLI